MELNSEFQEVKIEGNENIKPEQKNPENTGPVKKRGRPKRTDSEKTGEQKSEPKKPTQEKLNFEQLKSEYKTIKTETVQPQDNPTEVKNATLVSGYILLVVCDAVIPSFVVRIMRPRKPDLKADHLTLSKGEMEKLEPLADAAATELFGKLGAVSAFFFSVSAIYLGKAMTK